jgi:hypothetical protein
MGLEDPRTAGETAFIEWTPVRMPRQRAADNGHFVEKLAAQLAYAEKILDNVQVVVRQRRAVNSGASSSRAYAQ